MATNHPGGQGSPQLSGYDVLGRLGGGASGSVWAVRDGDGNRFAAKILPATAQELDYELPVLQALRHDHVVRLHDVLVDDATEPPGIALVMQLAEGGSLADALRTRHLLTPGELVTVLCPVARALHDLHGLGLVHGDLSPGNLLLTDDGRPLIADLGTSRLAGHAQDEVWATDTWAAPEVLSGADPTPASDVYSLGAIAWLALTGVAPEPAALRPDLAELAPHADQRLRDLVNAALAHTDSARPLPGEFAISLWQCADPEPAPVQGSPARRAAVATSHAASDSLTRRIRDQAAQDPPPVTDPGPSARVSVRAAGLIGVAAVAGTGIALLATGVLPWASGEKARSAVDRTATGSPGARPVHRIAGAGERGTPDRHARSATTPAAPPTGAQSGTKTTSTEATGTTATPVHAGAAKLSGDAVAVVQRLASARAAAWVHGDPGRLTESEQAGSPALRRDGADLWTAARHRVRYSGLVFTVRSARAHPGTGPVVLVSATIDRSAYDVVTRDGVRRLPAARGERAELSLRRTSTGWRVMDWRAPARR